VYNYDVNRTCFRKLFSFSTPQASKWFTHSADNEYDLWTSSPTLWTQVVDGEARPSRHITSLWPMLGFVKSTEINRQTERWWECNAVAAAAAAAAAVDAGAVTSSVACPFHDAYHFVYSNNSGGFCRNPVSYVRPCSPSSRLVFHFRHCSDAAYTYRRGPTPLSVNVNVSIYVHVITASISMGFNRVYAKRKGSVSARQGSAGHQ